MVVLLEEGGTTRVFEGGGDKASALGLTELAGGHAAREPLALGGGDIDALEVFEAGGDKVELEVLAVALGLTELAGRHAALEPLALGGEDKVVLLALGLTELGVGLVALESLAFLGRGVNGLPSACALSCLRLRRTSGGRGMARANNTQV